MKREGVVYLQFEKHARYPRELRFVNATSRKPVEPASGARVIRAVFAIDDEAFDVIDAGTVSIDTPDIAVDIDAKDTDQ